MRSQGSSIALDFAVHPGGMKMYNDLRRQYCWSEMKRHVGDFVRRCLMCQQVKDEHQRPARLLQDLEVAEWKWEHVTMDFMTHLPQSSVDGRTVKKDYPVFLRTCCEHASWTSRVVGMSTCP